MRIASKDRNHFRATHKGAMIEIEREKPPPGIDRLDWPAFYIRVTVYGGGYLYDGYAPKNIRIMRDAKHEALSCLDKGR